MKNLINSQVVIIFLVIFLAGCLNPQPEKPDPADPRPGILFVSDRSENWDLFLVQPDGSGLTQMTDHPAVDSDPDWSQDGRHIAFRSRRDGSSDIFVMGADGSGAVNLINDPADSIDDEFAPRWNPDGITFSLYSDRFPPRGNCTAGYHQLALLHTDRIEMGFDLFDTVPGEQYFSTWSPDGRYLIFNSSCRIPNSQLYIYDTQTGDTNQLTNEPNSHTHPAWSHDGRFLAYVANIDSNIDIFILDLETKRKIRLTHDLTKDTMPSWSSDDSQIAFMSNRDGNQEVYIMDVDGSNAYNLTQNPADDWYPSWSPVSNSP